MFSSEGGGKTAGMYLLMSAWIIAVSLMSQGIDTPDYRLFSDGYYVFPHEPNGCNCDGTTPVYSFNLQRIRRLTYRGVCENGWCGVGFSMELDDYIVKQISVPSGKCIDRISIALQGTPGFIPCEVHSGCPTGSYTPTTHAPTAVFRDCAAPPGEGG